MLKNAKKLPTANVENADQVQNLQKHLINRYIYSVRKFAANDEQILAEGKPLLF